MNIGRWVYLLYRKGWGVLIASMGGIILVQLPSLYKSEVNFQSKAISATGTVVETRQEKEERVYYSGGIPLSGASTKFISTVKFKTHQGESVNFTATAVCSSLRACENKEVPVLYDPISPSDARVDSGTTPEGKLTGGLVLSLVFLLPGIALIVLEPSERYAKSASSN